MDEEVQPGAMTPLGAMIRFAIQSALAEYDGRIFMEDMYMDEPAAPEKLITREEWEKMLDNVKIRKEDMNKLVMNFLLTVGYVEAAEKFGQDTGTEPDIDIGQVMAVKTALQSGNVQYAIEKVNDIDPAILGTSPQLFFRLQHQRLIELIRNHKTEEALECAQKYLAPMMEENQCTLEDLEKTVSLLGFEDPSDCPYGGELLDMTLRLKIASEVNAAILRSQHLDKDSKLLYLLKMLIWTQNQLGVKVAYPRINNVTTAIFEDPAF